MHELGIVFHIIKMAKEVAEENNVTQVTKLVLNLGEVSTVIPEYLTDCWQWAVKKEEMMEGCELEICMIPAVTICEDCHKEYPTVTYGKTCPYCGSEKTCLLQGNEIEIKEIEVKE